MYNTDRTIILAFQVMHSKVEITYSKRSQVANQGKYIFYGCYLHLRRNSFTCISMIKIMGRNKLLVLPHRSSLIYKSLSTKLFILQIEILLDALWT